MQVAEAVHRYGRKLGVRRLPIYGGQSLSPQFRALSRGVDVVVATPGRVLDHLVATRRSRSEQVERSFCACDSIHFQQCVAAAGSG